MNKGIYIRDLCNKLYSIREDGPVSVMGEQKLVAKQMVEFASFCHYSREEMTAIKHPAITLADWRFDFLLGYRVKNIYQLKIETMEKVESILKSDFLMLS